MSVRSYECPVCKVDFVEGTSSMCSDCNSSIMDLHGENLRKAKEVAEETGKIQLVKDDVPKDGALESFTLVYPESQVKLMKECIENARIQRAETDAPRRVGKKPITVVDPSTVKINSLTIQLERVSKKAVGLTYELDRTNQRLKRTLELVEELAPETTSSKRLKLLEKFPLYQWMRDIPTISDDESEEESEEETEEGDNLEYSSDFEDESEDSQFSKQDWTRQDTYRDF